MVFINSQIPPIIMIMIYLGISFVCSQDTEWEGGVPLFLIPLPRLLLLFLLNQKQLGIMTFGRRRGLRSYQPSDKGRSSDCLNPGDMKWSLNDLFKVVLVAVLCGDPFGGLKEGAAEKNIVNFHVMTLSWFLSLAADAAADGSAGNSG